MRTLAQAVEALTPEERARRERVIIREHVNASKRDGRRGYFFPGRDVRKTMLSTISGHEPTPCYRFGNGTARAEGALHDWLQTGCADAYVVAFCAANHLTD